MAKQLLLEVYLASLSVRMRLEVLFSFLLRQMMILVRGYEVISNTEKVYGTSSMNQNLTAVRTALMDRSTSSCPSLKLAEVNDALNSLAI